MTVFVCYSNRDKAAVRTLVEDLQHAGQTIWLDQKLKGADQWWFEILEQIRSCIVFAVAVSSNSLQSKSCQSEISYALALGLPILPVQIGDVKNYQFHPISRIQWVDYRNVLAGRGDARSGMVLIGALHALSAQRKPLPEPLPEPPPLPYEYLVRFHAAVTSPDHMPARDQMQLLAQLQSALNDEDDPHIRDDILRLLESLRRREDVTYRIAQDIDTLSAAARESPREREFDGPGAAPDISRQPTTQTRAADVRPQTVGSPTPAAVFVSYATDDDDGTAAQIADALSDRGITCFYAPRDLGPERDYQRVIPQAIRGCNALVALLSPAALRSPDVKTEVRLAFKYQKEILPFLLGGLSRQNVATDEDWEYISMTKQVHEYVSPGRVAEAASEFG